ncbi:MAG: hypothetical protein H7839_04965 [Magnetococcus sp. YQC-5]
MDMIRRESSVVSSDGWSGKRPHRISVQPDAQNEEVALPPPLGWSPDFLVDLFRYHMSWLSRVSGLTEAEAKRRVMNLLKAGRIGYQDESGNKRTLPSEAIVWVYRHV